jgi:hypothetical protein
MALASNALTTVASLEGYMGRAAPDADILAVYHDASASATAATVQVTDTTIVLVITGGANAGTDTLTLSSYTAVSDLVTAVNALAKGWVARSVVAGSDPTRLIVEPATSAYGSAATQWLRGVNTYSYDEAINAVSAFMERYCSRTFASATYRQLYHGTGHGTLALSQFPVTAVARASVGKLSALKVKNSSSDAREATVSNDLTDVTLTIVGGANDGSDTVAIGSNTITALATAITAVGKNWTAAASSSTPGGWPATELFKHEALHCLDEELPLYAPDIGETSYSMDGDAGILHRGTTPLPFYTRSAQAHHPPHVPPFTEPGGDIWPRGMFNVYVNYTAGYSTIPVDLALLCNEIAASILRAGTHDMSVTAEAVAGYSYTNSPHGWLSESTKQRLNVWRRLPPYPEYVDV